MTPPLHAAISSSRAVAPACHLRLPASPRQERYEDMLRYTAEAETLEETDESAYEVHPCWQLRPCCWQAADC